MKVGDSLVGVHPPTGVALLTYDDGPTADITDQLLPELAEAGARATFFVLLSRVRKAPGLLAEVVAAGHQVGLHGRDHRLLTDVAPAELPALLRDARAELEDLLGSSVELFRPPYGKQSASSWQATVDAGMTPVMWGLTCRDWLTLDPEEYLLDVRRSSLRGQVVLMHDGFPDGCDGVDDGPAPELDRVELIRGVLAEVRRQGLKAVTLGEALTVAAPAWELRLSGQRDLRTRIRGRLAAVGENLRTRRA
ncbi:polysaccharide deacetylase family protein [Nocardioides montaniterrae]